METWYYSRMCKNVLYNVNTHSMMMDSILDNFMAGLAWFHQTFSRIKKTDVYTYNCLASEREILVKTQQDVNSAQTDPNSAH